MYLKALAIKGFKSFADPATLQFEPGVTVVVGPNGSGKSNVVDAVAWVLGAQGPRTVRSSKMDDVIFAGSADRPALGRAEVSLTIDNRAGSLPGGLAEITVTRTLFRSGDSEYAINGRTCRLLDVQELLSDSGIGRRQHVIISQGQLDEILNARPEDRRVVIEEAAGILKHRRRRERAERRLAAAEDNLERLGDLVREVRRQIRPLERQAAAARSHGALSEELHALRLYLVGRDLAGLSEHLEGKATERDMLSGEERSRRAALEELDGAVDQMTLELAGRREEDLVAVLARLEGLAERCRGVGAVLGERRRSLARALDAAADTDVVSTLESEAARLSEELDTTQAERDKLGPESSSLDTWEDELAQAASGHGAAFADVDERRAAEEALAVARGQADPLRRALDRDRANLARLEDRLNAASDRLDVVTGEADQLAAELAGIAADDGLEQRVWEARQAAASGAEALRIAEEHARTCERERHRLEARAEALARAVSEARGTTGAATLAGIAGVVGVLMDLVDVDDGWAAAFEAAVGAAVGAVVVEGSDSARTALARLSETGSPGSLLALSGSTVGSRGPLGTDPMTVGGVEAVRPHVRPRVRALETALDVLLAPAVAVGDWRTAVDVALDHPDLVVVTHEGDRFAPSGWQVGAGRGEVSQSAAEHARTKAILARETAEQAAVAYGAARSAAEDAAARAVSAARDLERAADRRMAVSSAHERMAAEVAALRHEQAETGRHRAELADRLERDDAQLVELEERLPQLERNAAAAAARLAEATADKRRLDERRTELANIRRDLEVRAAGLAEREVVLADRLRDVERRLAGHAAERHNAAERRLRLEADALAVDRLTALVQQHGTHLGSLLDRIRRLRSRHLDEARESRSRLDALRRRRAETEELLGEIRDRIQQVDLDLAETRVRREAIEDAIRRELESEPQHALEAPRPSTSNGVDDRQRVVDLEAQLAALGPINPLALDELNSVEERHRFLDEQVEDVRRARRDLQQVIGSVDDEIARLFVDAFGDVNEHFQALIGTLFPGGTGRLSLTDPSNLLDTGVEVEARPAGKNVRKLTLLSGGERSLVALAFLFAVFRSRPSPFYLMDEVEAALDDVNLHRFLDLLHEFREEAQLIIVSHQKRTMEAADAVYGVTLQSGGSSKVVSQKVRHDPEDEPSSAIAGV